MKTLPSMSRPRIKHVVQLPQPNGTELQVTFTIAAVEVSERQIVSGLLLKGGSIPWEKVQVVQRHAHITIEGDVEQVLTIMPRRRGR